MNEIVPMHFTGLDGEQFESAMFKIALDRFDRAMHHLACGVYYHHNERKWMGKSSSLSNMFGTSGNISSPENRFIARQIEIISKSFEELSVHGENQKTFSYQMYTKSDLEHAMRLRFFEDIEIFIVLGHDI